jgi:PAS domain S-box-containing protein
VTGPPSLEPLGRADRELPGAGSRGGATGSTGGYAVGSYGLFRLRLPQFALLAVGTVLIAVLPFPSGGRREIAIAGVLFFVLVAAAFLLPFERLPDGAWLILPVGYMAVIGLLRDAQGGSRSGLIVVYALPIVWLAVYGRLSHLLVGLFFMDVALLVPVLIIGKPDYPESDWRQVVVMAAVTTLVSSLISIIVSRNRDYVNDLAQQSRFARRSALAANNSRDRLETLLRAATGSAIMGVDPTGMVTLFSAGAEQLLGYSAAEVVGIRSIADFIDPAQIDERRQTIDSMSDTGMAPLDADTAAEVPWTATRKDGQQRRCVVRVRALPTPDPAMAAAAAEEAATTAGADPADSDATDPAIGPTLGEIGGYVIVAIDVTEREELAAERERLLTVQSEVTQSLIEQNNRLRELTQMKDDVVATVSHELRTPITSIRGFIELLMEDATAGLSPEHLKMLSTIDRNSAQLQRVAEDLLADPGAGHGLRVAFTELDVRRIAEDAVEAMQTAAKTAGVSVTLAEANGTTSDIVPVFGDSGRLHQLLGNLLSNAIKFSPRGGHVLVTADCVDRFARLQVMDEGPGIPEGERAQLFERFYRLASSTEAGVPGTGLGLAIAKSVAEAHEGFVEIADTPGWSTTFRVFIPLLESDDLDGSETKGKRKAKGSLNNPA